MKDCCRQFAMGLPLCQDCPAAYKPVPASEMRNRLFDAMATCDSDCASRESRPCDCGAKDFAERFGRKWRVFNQEESAS